MLRAFREEERSSNAMRLRISSSNPRVQLIVRLFINILKYKIRRKHLSPEIDSLRTQLENTATSNQMFIGCLRQAQLEAEERYINYLFTYDNQMKALHRKRSDLIAIRDSLRQEISSIEKELLIQRIEYAEAKSHWNILLDEAFQECLNDIRRRHAALTIQRHWRACIHCIPSKKKRSRK